MKPTDLQVYDALPAIINAVAKGARALHQMPLDQMLTVLDRVEAAGCYNAQGRQAQSGIQRKAPAQEHEAERPGQTEHARSRVRQQQRQR